MEPAALTSRSVTTECCVVSCSERQSFHGQIMNDLKQLWKMPSCRQFTFEFVQWSTRESSLGHVTEHLQALLYSRVPCIVRPVAICIFNIYIYIHKCLKIIKDTSTSRSNIRPEIIPRILLPYHHIPRAEVARPGDGARRQARLALTDTNTQVCLDLTLGKPGKHGVIGWYIPCHELMASAERYTNAIYMWKSHFVKFVGGCLYWWHAIWRWSFGRILWNKLMAYTVFFGHVCADLLVFWITVSCRMQLKDEPCIIYYI